MRIHIFQHVLFEWIGHIETWAHARGHTLGVTRFFEPFVLPDPNQVDLLVVMGGPMGVHDEAEYPWLAVEKKFLYPFVHGGHKCLGICLGAQLIADVLGARVYKNPQKEIGWYPVKLTPEGAKSGFFLPGQSSLTTFQWHGDTFDLPRGALHLARSEACENQAFSRGRTVLGVQFHIEMSTEEVRELCANCHGDLADPGPFVQDVVTMETLAKRYSEECRRQLECLLDRIVVGCPGV